MAGDGVVEKVCGVEEGFEGLELVKVDVGGLVNRFGCMKVRDEFEEFRIDGDG